MLLGYTFSSFPMIINKQKIKKNKYNAMNNFDNTDWNYKKLIKRTESTYYILQKAWTDEIIEGVKENRQFIEYWLFVKKKKGKWLLSKIYQEDELNKISL